MIKLSNKITVQIGEEKSFKIIVNRPTPENLTQLSLLEDKHASSIDTTSKVEKEISELAIAIAETQGILETNMALLKLSLDEVSFKDRFILLLENKKLVPKLAELQRKRAVLDRPDYKEAYTFLEDIYKKRFELTVENNEQKAALALYAGQKSVTYGEIFEDINKEIIKEDKKKSNASEDGQNK